MLQRIGGLLGTGLKQRLKFRFWRTTAELGVALMQGYTVYHGTNCAILLLVEGMTNACIFEGIVLHKI